MVDKNSVKKRYDIIKMRMEKCFAENLNELGFQYAKLACQYMYSNNYIYSDYSLERRVNSVVKNFFKSSNNGCKNNRLLFYQFAPRDLRGLAYIYLNALVKSNIEFVWVTYKSYKTENQKGLIALISACEHAMLRILDDTNGAVNLINEWNNLLDDLYPKWALVIPAPWDIECLSVLNCYKDMIKILVNGTDHTFWYGATVFDKILEFRDWGCVISRRYRLIDENKLIKFPYYPKPSYNEFKGLPFEKGVNTKLIVSGGSTYKIFGSNIFFNTVKHILECHDDCIFYFMGNGNVIPIYKFIKENALEGRFYISPERNDFDEVIKLSYLYLNTYPLIGGLMTQYAVANNVIPVGLQINEDSCNDISGLFLKRCIFSCKTIEELWDEIDRLIDDSEYYKKKKESLDDLLLSEDQFNTQLKLIINGKFDGYEFHDVNVDLEEFRKQYLARQNRFIAWGKLYIRILCIQFPIFVKLKKYLLLFFRKWRIRR